jgi:hypothetical protein
VPIRVLNMWGEATSAAIAAVDGVEVVDIGPDVPAGTSAGCTCPEPASTRGRTSS